MKVELKSTQGKITVILHLYIKVDMSIDAHMSKNESKRKGKLKNYVQY